MDSRVFLHIILKVTTCTPYESKYEYHRGEIINFLRLESNKIIVNSFALFPAHIDEIQATFYKIGVHTGDYFFNFFTDLLEVFSEENFYSF